jgi:hypothetical protein
MVTAPSGWPSIPHTVYSLPQFGIDAGNELLTDAPPAPDHGVHVVGARHADRGQIDLLAQAPFLRIEDECPDVLTDIEHQCVRGTTGRTLVDVRRLHGAMRVGVGVGMRVVIVLGHCHRVGP